MMVRGPGIRENAIVDRPVESTDLVPTLGSLFGFSASFQGKPCRRCCRLFSKSAAKSSTTILHRRSAGSANLVLLQQLPWHSCVAAAGAHRLRLEVSR